MIHHLIKCEKRNELKNFDENQSKYEIFLYLYGYKNTLDKRVIFNDLLNKYTLILYQTLSSIKHESPIFTRRDYVNQVPRTIIRFTLHLYYSLTDYKIPIINHFYKHLFDCQLNRDGCVIGYSWLEPYPMKEEDLHPLYQEDGIFQNNIM
jgi:hypothetical protein